MISMNTTVKTCKCERCGRLCQVAETPSDPKRTPSPEAGKVMEEIRQLKHDWSHAGLVATASHELLRRTRDLLLSNRLRNALTNAQPSRELQEEIHRLSLDLKAAREAAAGNYWCWIPDFEANHLDSLVCPVMIRAEDLRRLLSASVEGVIPKEG